MSREEHLRIIAVGDLSFNGHYRRLLERHPPGWPFRMVLPDWRGADLVLGNLESPLATSPRVCHEKLTLRGAPRAAQSLKSAGFDCVSLANNHAMDFGPEGLIQTMERLDALGIMHHGAGKDEEAASKPSILHRKNQSIGLLAFCDVEQGSPLYAGQNEPGVARFDPERACSLIRKLKPAVDWLIVQLHWGREMSELPGLDQRAQARQLAEAGADLILGHHPHILQPLELINGVPVFYSLGNFLFSEAYWRGEKGSGEKFYAKMRIPDLSRGTGWADVTLHKGRPAQVILRPARLGPDLTVRPETTVPTAALWEELCLRLSASDYQVGVESENRLSRERLRSAHASHTLARKIELRLFHHGLMPLAAEET